MISPARLSDLLSDPRMPYFIPYVKLKQRSKRLSNVDIPDKSPLLIALTFDVEYDFGSSAREVSFDAIGPFLQQLPALAEEWQAAFTLFVQGDIVERYAQLLLNLQPRHEIGLHGYAHELWGKAKWFLPQKPISYDTRKMLLEEGLKAFSTSHLAAPVSFRAPDLVADTDTLQLLEEQGFLVDSSAPSYYGIPPLPARPLGSASTLLSIPITAAPDPRIRTRYLLPFVAYEVFNMAWLAITNDHHLLGYVDEVMSFQINAGTKPHLVFLAHPWEFREWTEKKGYDYCSKDNYELLRRKLQLLKERYQLRYVCLKELAQLLDSKQDG
ncbi:MAG: polysaccharide deacetylase family protein [Chloroflexota bacterium]|nr:polysaccharide deacetylase family protein [Chloroflexota bacterium]